MSATPAPHAPSWYAASAPDRPPAPALEGARTTDVAVVGGGYAGLGAALRLAEGGASVALLEANRIGWGASGRNGGQIHSGFRRTPDWFEARGGFDHARAVWDLGEAAKANLRDLVDAHNVDCDLRQGLIEAIHRAGDVVHEQDEALRLAERFGSDDIEALDRAATAEALGTDVYFGALRDRGGGHLHPLKLAHGLAQAAERAGAMIFEASPVTALAREGDGRIRLTTSHGTLVAGQVVLAGNGYIHGLSATYDARVLPITNFVLATEPIGAGAPGGVLAGGECAADSRFVVHYWRPTPDGRILFGGGEKFSTAFPQDIKGFVHKRFARIYPGLKNVAVTHAWGGTLAVTQNRLPFIREVERNIFAIGGFSGQGVALAPFAGRVVAEALLAGREHALAAPYRIMSGFACPPFPGGRLLRAPILTLAMTWFALRDRL